MCVAQKRRCLKINLSTTLLNRPQKIVLFINAGKYCVKITGDNPYNGPTQKGYRFRASGEYIIYLKGLYAPPLD